MGERKTRGQELARLLTILSDTDKEVFRVSQLKIVLPFLTNQAIILLTWFYNFIFSHEFHMALP